MNAIDILRRDHERVRELFSEYDKLARDAARRNEIARSVLRELEMHSRVEEDIFYPAMRSGNIKEGRELVKLSMEEEHQINSLIAELRNTDISDPDFEDKFQELAEDVEEHFTEEEKDLFPKAQVLGKELDSLGDQIQEEKDTLG